MKKTLLFILILFFGISGIDAQIGKWTSHLPFNRAENLAIANNKVYCSSESGLFYYNLDDNSIYKLSKEDGLSDIGISTIAYSEKTDHLIIAYNNANIDLIKDNTVFNLPDIKRKQIIGDKNIYNIHFIDELAYLSCGFGIVVIDLEKREIRETYYIGAGGSQIKVNDITSLADSIYAATDAGLFTANLTNPNLIDFNNWSMVNDPEIFGEKITTVTSTSTHIFINVDDDHDRLYMSDGTSWERYPYLDPFYTRSLNSSGDNLIICSQFNIHIFSPSGESIRSLYVGTPLKADVDRNNTLWIADRVQGLLKSDSESEKIPVIPEGPPNKFVTGIEIQDNKLIAVAGGTSSSWGNLFRAAEYYSFVNHTWEGWRTDSVRDLVNIQFHPNDTSHYFLGSWGYGLLEFKNSELINLYDEHNSSLETIIPGGDFIRIGGLAYDNDKNLWVTNSGVPHPLSVLKNNGEWKGFPLMNEVNASTIGKIIHTSAGHLWIILPRGKGLFVYSVNGTIDNTDDDDYLKLSVRDKNNKVITNDIYDIAEDRNGNIWLGTNKGILVYYSPSRVFSNDNFYAQQIIIPRNDGSGLGDPLLESETVSAIEVDGANRKWLGTTNAGAFLVSDDGLKEIHAFNTDNSPILSNSITDIAINEETGAVFFGTDNGIVSYNSDATEPDQTFSDVYVYPNPVREDYSGDIVIAGLVENTIVKITDLNGNLVSETKSLGGQALWDGKNLNGDKAATGVYLVFLSNEEGTLTHVTKLLLIH